jgi:hypothetical protein
VELLTKKEVCEMLRCSARTLDRWRAFWRERDIDVGEVKICRKVRFRREKIEALAAAPKMWLRRKEGRPGRFGVAHHRADFWTGEPPVHELFRRFIHPEQNNRGGGSWHF